MSRVAGRSAELHQPRRAAARDRAVRERPQADPPADFDGYVAEHDIPEEKWPEAFARWIAERTGGPVPRFEKVAPGHEQILEDQEQRDLDSLPSALDRED